MIYEQMFGAEDLKYLLVVMWVLGIKCVSFKEKSLLQMYRILSPVPGKHNSRIIPWYLIIEELYNSHRKIIYNNVITKIIYLKYIEYF